MAALLALAALALPAAASANTVVNGDFETGNFEGWTVANEPPDGGSWFVYAGTEAPFGEGGSVPPPPQGKYAAITDQGGPGTRILYQDVPIEPGQPYLSMTAYYESVAPIAVPQPETLNGEEGAEDNQQYRIEVIDPEAPIDSLEPEDVLATVFRTLPGAPQTVGLRAVGVDLSAFVGEEVRLRLVEVDNLGYFHAGVDSVATGPVPPPPFIPKPTPVPPVASPSNAFTLGKLKLNKKKGTATLKVTVPGAGVLTAVDAKKKAKSVKKATAIATGAGTATLRLKPTGRGMKALKQTGKLPFKLSVAFTPTGGTAAGQPFSGKLKLNLDQPKG